MVNLDLSAAEKAQAILRATIDQDEDISNVDNLATKTLGVLQENGVYAAVLFLHSRTRKKDKEMAEQISRYLLELLPEVGIEAAPLLHQKDAQKVLKFLSGHVLCDLDQLLLVKRIWEQTLIYTRYGAKAREEKE